MTCSVPQTKTFTFSRAFPAKFATSQRDDSSWTMASSSLSSSNGKSSPFLPGYIMPSDSVARNLVLLVGMMASLLVMFAVSHPAGTKALVYSVPLATAFVVLIALIMLRGNILKEK